MACSSVIPPISPNQIDREIEERAQKWITEFFEDFDPRGTKTYTIRQLYASDVCQLEGEVKRAQEVYDTLWDREGFCWVGALPPGWEEFGTSNRSFTVLHPGSADFLYKFCSGKPGRGVPGSHFLRVAKGKEIKRETSDLNELEVVDETLIALKTEEEIRGETENSQCFYFVVKSKKMDLLNQKQTIEAVSLYPEHRQIEIAEQIMKMICRTGLGDVGFHNLHVNRETGKLVVVDTEPLFGSLVLDEEEQVRNQYSDNNRIKSQSSNALNVRTGLGQMIEACRQKLPLFEKVATVYQSVFEEHLAVATRP